MAPLKLNPAVPDGTPHRYEDKAKERLFLEHYSWLEQCALNITHGQREHAQDLVHDVFLQFLDSDLDLAMIGDLRGYLNGILRNLHLLQLRRTTRHPVQSLSLLDHDSAMVSLRVGNSADRLQSADLLVRACDFACYRKEATLTASILILRFFHGYYPGEICLLLDAGRKVVDKSIERGRVETKEYLATPYALPNFDKSSHKMVCAATSTAFLRLLRERIFDSCTTDCSVLADHPDELGVKELAHLVSCCDCLDRRSRKVGLGYVAERMADDISDRDDGHSQGGKAGGGKLLPLRPRRKPSKRAILRQLYARRRERFEHRPKEISLAFDGQLHATLLINAPANTLNLSLDNKEVPNFIAVLSEQEFHFLLLGRSELMSSEQHVHRLMLSDDRFLEITVTPETLGPSIQVVYEDPHFSAASNEAVEEEIGTLKAPAEDRILTFPSERGAFAGISDPGWWRAPFDRLRSFVPDMNLLLASAIVLGTASVICLVFWMRGQRFLTASELLNNAQKSEHAIAAANRPGVIYQKVSIRTPRRSVGRTIYRDEQGIRHPRRQKLSPEDEQLKDQLAAGGVDWDAPLSAVDYAAWRQRSGATRDEVTRSGQHLLTLTTTPLLRSQILKETLTVRDSDFHAVNRTVELRDSGTIEIAELNYDVLPWGAVNPDWFEPLTTTSGKVSRDVHPSLLPRVHPLLTGLELDEAELETRLVLNRLHADTSERLQIVRDPNGILVKGIVETEARKQEIEKQLIKLSHVTPAIFTFEETERWPSAETNATSVAQNSVVAEPSPLERFLLKRGESQAEVSETYKGFFGASVTVNQNSKSMVELLRRFGSGVQLTAAAQSALEQLIRQDESGIDAALQEQLTLIRAMEIGGNGAVPETPSAAPADALQAAATRNVALSNELITSGNAQSRSAETIVSELSASIAQIQSILAHLPRQQRPQRDSLSSALPTPTPQR